MGIYAGDHESYELFANVFNPIILEYHGLSSIIYFEHTPDMDVEKIEGSINPEAPVISTRYLDKKQIFEKILISAYMHILIYIC